MTRSALLCANSSSAEQRNASQRNAVDAESEGVESPRDALAGHQLELGARRQRAEDKDEEKEKEEEEKHSRRMRNRVSARDPLRHRLAHTRVHVQVRALTSSYCIDNTCTHTESGRTRARPDGSPG